MIAAARGCRKRVADEAGGGREAGGEVVNDGIDRRQWRMEVTCPACAAGYAVPDALLRPGRRMVCHVCNAEWRWQEPGPLAAPLPDMAVVAPPPLVAVPPLVAPPAPAPRASGGWALAVGWVGSLALLVAAGAAAVVYREAVRQAWPAAGWLYRAIGLE